MAAIGRDDGVALSEPDRLVVGIGVAGRGADRAVGPATALEVEAAVPGVRHAEVEADGVGQAANARALVQAADDLAVRGQPVGGRVLLRADDGAPGDRGSGEGSAGRCRMARHGDEQRAERGSHDRRCGKRAPGPGAAPHIASFHVGSSLPPLLGGPPGT